MKQSQKEDGYYQIEVKGGEIFDWSYWFEDMTLIEGNQQTIIRGHIADRMALDELIHHIYAHQMNLLSVKCLKKD